MDCLGRKILEDFKCGKKKLNIVILIDVFSVYLLEYILYILEFSVL